jgi:flagellar M-ring protein FliF
MNFEQVRETEEKFDPDGQVPRSTHSMTDSTKSTEQNPSVSVQNNLPNNDAGNANATGSQEQKQDETTNYEIGKTSRTVLREQPRIQRVSLAVLVDGVEDRGADGKLTYRERTPDELEQIAKLVRTTIGFDEKRGDHVEVVNMRFVAEAPAETAATSTLFGIPIEKGELVGIAESVLPAVLALLGLLFVLRPLVLRLTTLPASVAAVAIGDAGFDATMMAASESAGGGGVPRIGGPGGDAAGGLALVPVGATPEEDEMVNVGQIEGQIKSSSIKRIVEMADKYPNETLAIVRTWMTQEAAE